MFFISGWLIAAAVLVVLELFSQGLYLFLSFGIGCIPAAIAQFYDASFNVQFLLWGIGFLISFFILFKISQKRLHKEQDQGAADHYKSVVDALPGKKGIVFEALEGDLSWGLVKLKDGQEWSAQSVDGKSIPVGMEIVVVRVEGVRLIVAPYVKV